MTLYRYKVLTADGLFKKGVQEALSRNELKEHFRSQGFSLISYSIKRPNLFYRKVPLRTLIDFCLHMKQFEQAGISLKDSLEELAFVSESLRLKHILKMVINDIEGGLVLSKALSKHPTVFDAVFVGMITVGEKTGRLPFVLDHLSQHYKWRDETQTLTFKAIRYPLIIGLVLILLMSVLMTILVPELVVFIRHVSTDLPLSTQILIGISTFFLENYGLLVCFLVCFVVIIAAFRKIYPEGIDLLFNRLPFIGPLRRKFALLKFFHVFTILFESGIDILSALRLSLNSFNPGEMSHAIQKIGIFIEEGVLLSQAFDKSYIFPRMVIHMINMGEETSTLSHSLHHIKDYLEVTLKRQIDMIVGLIEPALLLCVGSIIAWIIYALFLPLYDTLSMMEP